jgi:hypothetical protein
MIDSFALALTHALLILAAWRLISRADLDDAKAPPPPPPAERPRGFARSRKGA